MNSQNLEWFKNLESPVNDVKDYRRVSVEFKFQRLLELILKHKYSRQPYTSYFILRSSHNEYDYRIEHIKRY